MKKALPLILIFIFAHVAFESSSHTHPHNQGECNLCLFDLENTIYIPSLSNINAPAAQQYEQSQETYQSRTKNSSKTLHPPKRGPPHFLA